MPLVETLNILAPIEPPKRLSEKTRSLAKRGLSGEFGRQMVMLIDAQNNPEKYPNLAVRISGWSARFNTLSREWQDMIIQRTQQFFS